MGCEKRHAWEIAGLGSAPYTYIGHTTEHFQACPGAPLQVGGSCDFCGQGISEMYRFRSADGRTFKVGSDCVKRAGDAGLVKMISADVRRHASELRAARELARIAAAVALIDTISDRLAALPHPLAWRAAQGGTMLEWARWMLDHSGHSGKLSVAKAIERVANTASGVTA